MTLLAYHNDPAIKEKYLTRVRAHRAADQIIHGTYWEGGKGCAVGCTIHSSDHARYETALGVPVALAQLEDAIFEGLENGEAQAFPERFLAAIPVGADLSRVPAQFFVWLLTSDEIGLPTIADERGRAAIADVAALWQRTADGGEVSQREWAAAWAAARAAAGAAAWNLMAEKLLSLLAEAPVPGRDEDGESGRAGE